MTNDEREHEQQRLRPPARRRARRSGPTSATPSTVKIDAAGQRHPERGVAVDRAQVLALDQRRAERQVGEDQHEAREHERERGEAVLLGRQQARDDDRHDRARELGAHLRGADPREALAGRARADPGPRGADRSTSLPTLGPARRDEPVRSFRLARRARLYGDVHVRHRRRLQARRRDAPALPEHVLRAMTDDHRLPRPRRRRLRVRRRLLARRPPALDHRRRGRPPAVRRTSAAASGRAQNGEIYNHDALRDELRGARPRAAQPLRHRGPPPPLRGARARRWPSTCAACSPSPSGTRTPAAAC